MIDSQLDVPESWLPALNQIKLLQGVVLIAGNSDTGKTRFCRIVANVCADIYPNGIPRLDLDMGQNEVSPPATVAWSRCKAEGFEPATLSHTRFLGSISPTGRIAKLVACSRSLLDSCGHSNPLILADTCGFVRGVAAARLFDSLAIALRPRHVVLLQRGDECEHLIASLRYSTAIHLHRLEPSPQTGKKTPAMRLTRRTLRYAAYFDGATRQTYLLSETACTSTWIGSGTALPPHYLKVATDTLKCRVHYGEQRTGFMGLLISGQVRNPDAVSDLQRHFRIREIAISCAEQMKHLLVGLHDGDGAYLGLGSIQSMDFVRRSIDIVSPVRTPGSVRQIDFGLVRIRPDGTQAGVIGNV